MSFGVHAVLDRLLHKDRLPSGYARDHELVINTMFANAVSPSNVGYLCLPAPPRM